MSQIRAVIFDYYSTLLDIQTNEGKEELYEYLSLYLQYYGANIGPQKVRSAIELEKERCFKTSQERYPELDMEVVFRNVLSKEGLNNEFLAESCTKLFRLLSRERFKLFPDSLPVLREMKSDGYPLAVITDAQKSFCLEEAKMVGLIRFFNYIVISTYFGFRKPDPRLFAVACDLLDVEPGRAVYIGNDPRTDIKGAKQIGMKSILLTREPKGRTPEIEPDFRAGSLWEAWHWIRRSDWAPASAP